MKGAGVLLLTKLGIAANNMDDDGNNSEGSW